MTAIADAPKAKKAQTKSSKGGIRDFGQGGGEIRMVKPSEITIDPAWNVRDFSLKVNKDRVDELYADIKENGVRNALTVKIVDGKLHLRGGETRLRAALRVEKDGTDILVPVQNERKGISELDSIAGQQQDNNSKQFEPIELANLAARMSKLGAKDADIARKFGKTPPYVAGLLKLYAAPEPIKEAVLKEEITAGTAISIIRSAKDDKEATQLVSDAIAEAKLTGASHAMPKHVAAVKERKTGSAAETPMYYKREYVNNTYFFLSELAANNEKNNEGVPHISRKIKTEIKNFLESIDIDFKAWNDEAKVAADEEDAA